MRMRWRFLYALAIIQDTAVSGFFK